MNNHHINSQCNSNSHQQKPALEASSKARVKAAAEAERHAARLVFVGKLCDSFEHLADGTLIATGHSINAAGQTRHYLAAFVGKTTKPHRRAFGSYRSEAARGQAIEQIKSGLAAHAAAKAARREERKQPHTLTVGAVLYSSWGYDQTNVDFYEVVAVRGALVDIRALATKRTDTGNMSGNAVPVPGKYVGEVIRGKRPCASNTVRLTSFSSAGAWDGKPKSWTSYA